MGGATRLLKGVMVMEYKEWLIGELAIAEAQDDWDRMQSLGCELYELYGWAGQPYFTH
jgi:hypothetical protein